MIKFTYSGDGVHGSSDNLRPSGGNRAGRSNEAETSWPLDSMAYMMRVDVHSWLVAKVEPTRNHASFDDSVTIATESLFLVLLVIFDASSSLYQTIMQIGVELRINAPTHSNATRYSQINAKMTNTCLRVAVSGVFLAANHHPHSRLHLELPDLSQILYNSLRHSSEPCSNAGILHLILLDPRIQYELQRILNEVGALD